VWDEVGVGTKAGYFLFRGMSVHRGTEGRKVKEGISVYSFGVFGLGEELLISLPEFSLIDMYGILTYFCFQPIASSQQKMSS